MKVKVSIKNLVVIAALALFAALPMRASACVGKSLVIGTVNSPAMSVMTEMLSILITERTGTTVVIKDYDSYAALADAVKKSQVDIIVDYTGRCYVDVLGNAPDTDEGKVFSTVKEVYQRDMNLVWLEPFGFSGQGAVSAKGGTTPEVAAPIVRKDTLGKFPALPRVINKLAGKVDNAVMNRLISEGGNGKMKKATRKFLKDNRLI